MKKIVISMVSLVLLCVLAIHTEILPVNASELMPQSRLPDNLLASSGPPYLAGGTYLVDRNKEISIPHNQAGDQGFSWYWSQDGKSWKQIKYLGYSVNGIVDTGCFKFYDQNTSAHVNFYTTGSFFLKYYTYSSTVLDQAYTWAFEVVNPITAGLSVSPSSVTLATGATTNLNVNASNVTNVTYTVTDPRIASPYVENGELVLHAWNAGTTTVRFTGSGSYGNAYASCSVTVTGKSVKKPITLCGAAGIGRQTYTGKAITPKLTIKDFDYTLAEGTDYTLSYLNNVSVGTATVVISGKGVYNGTSYAQFTIAQSISDAQITLSGGTTFPYNDSYPRPVPTVVLNRKTLTEGTDYTVSYQNNNKVGTAKVIITGIGAYSGTAEKEFTIVKGTQILTLSCLNNEVVVGKTATISVSGAKTALTFTSSDATIASVNSTGVLTGRKTGEVTITVTASESTNYNGTSASIQIKSVLPHGFCGIDASWMWDEANGELTISGSGPMTDYSKGIYAPWWGYSGKIKTVTIQSGVTSVGQNAFNSYHDYATRVYSMLTSVTIPGTVKRIADNAFYCCEKLSTVNISEGVQEIGRYAFYSCYGLETLTLPASLETVDANAFSSCRNLSSVTILNSKTRFGSDAFIYCTRLQEVWFNGSEAEWNTLNLGLPADVSVHFTGQPIGMAQITLAGANGLAYDGTDKKPVPTVVVSGKTLKAGTDYTVSYQNNRNPGTAKVIIIGIGSYTGTVEREFTIAKAAQTLKAFVVSSNLKVGQTEAITVTGAKTTLTYSSNNPSVATVGSTGIIRGVAKGSASITIKAAENTYYQAASAVLQISVGEAINSCGDNVYWKWDESTKTLTIFGSGGMTDFENEDDAPWWEYHSLLETVTIESGVTSVGRAAFSLFYSSLTKVTLPNTITEIGDFSFAYCPIQSISLQQGLKTIGAGAFTGCSALTSVTIPRSVTKIGMYAFSECSSLASVKVSDVFQSALTLIDESAFEKCIALKNVIFPYGLTTIGAKAFSSCNSLSGIALPDTITEIGRSAFSDCNSLTQIDMPNGVKKLGDFAFSNCSGLTSVTVPASVTDFGEMVFYHCISLTRVTLADGLTQIGDDAFWFCSALKEINLPAGLKSIGYGAFNNCSNLTSVTIPNSVNSIGLNSFGNCTKLTDIWFLGSETEWNSLHAIIPNTVTVHFGGAGVFRLPAALRILDSNCLSGIAADTIIVPNSVTTILSGAFANCKNLKTLVFDGSPSIIANNMLSGCTGVTIRANRGSGIAAWAEAQGFRVEYN